jgi:thiol-disulfide isomerase/thioredoxin
LAEPAILSIIFAEQLYFMKNSLVLALSLLIVTASFSQEGSVKKKVPEITLKDTSGKEIKLSSLKGKVVLIDFWASWCGPCRRANKHLKKLYDKYKDQGLEILSISVDDSKSAWKKAIKDDKTGWLHVIDEINLASSWNIQFIPTTYLVDKEGNFSAINPDIDELDGLIKELVK